MPYLPFKSQYNTHPQINIKGFEKEVWQGYDNIIQIIKEKQPKVLVIDCYHGVNYKELEEYLIKELHPDLSICADDAAFTADEIKTKMLDHITDDRVFGVMSFHKLEQFFHQDKIEQFQKQITSNSGLVIVYGVGASLITKGDTLVYADLARWELQMRYRSGELANWRDDNYNEDILRRYKRGYFMEWRWADEHKKSIYNEIDLYLDTNEKNDPKMITGNAFLEGLKQASLKPFRLKPYFDPGVWGGQWMKEVCHLDPSKQNYAWSFDGVPEENSILLNYNNIVLEVPSINIVFLYPKNLLGERVFARFGAEFPIRFDFLDTMKGQNLSLQVHPTVEYAYKNFGIKYTQDESYYILDATDDAVVYLGLKDNVDSKKMILDLKSAEKGEITFPADDYINMLPCKKHDHFLIPAGTLHCSGTNTMVLEISATPYIFTFKLWDWDRVGLDGLPRPVHVDHGSKVIQWDRTTQWTKDNLVNNITVIEENKNYKKEKTGLHEFEFIETNRYTIDKEVTISSQGSVHMLNLVEGEEITILSVDSSFDPLIIHYAETFIIPCACKQYKIIPSGNSIGKTVKVMQALVKG